MLLLDLCNFKITGLQVWQLSLPHFHWRLHVLTLLTAEAQTINADGEGRLLPLLLVCVHVIVDHVWLVLLCYGHWIAHGLSLADCLIDFLWLIAVDALVERCLHGLGFFRHFWFLYFLLGENKWMRKIIITRHKWKKWICGKYGGLRPIPLTWLLSPPSFSLLDIVENCCCLDASLLASVAEGSAYLSLSTRLALFEVGLLSLADFFCCLFFFPPIVLVCFSK